MSLIRLLQLLTVMLALLSAWMLSLGENQPWMLPVAATGVAVLLVLNDWYSWFHLHRLLANAGMLIAAGLSLNDFFGQSSREQLIAIGELLVYVQVILLLQRKSDRIYGQVAVFSLLAVVVAALLNQSLTFGLLLLAYTVIGVFALALFSLFRAVDGTGLRPLRRRAPQFAGQVEIVPAVSSSDTGRLLLRLGVLRELGGLSLATLLFGATFFYSLPRIGGSGWQDGGSAASHRVGFSPEITFSQMGKLLRNNDLVMRTTFRNMRTGDPYTVITEPYFRGALLTRYVIEKGEPKWKQDLGRGLIEGVRLQRPKQSREIVAVEALLEPTRDSRLFHIYPPYATRNTPDNVRFHPGLRVLYRAELERGRRFRSRSFRYELATTGFRFGLQTPVTPHINPALTSRQKRSLEAEKRRLLKMRPEDYDRLGEEGQADDRFPGLRKLAKEIIQERAAEGGRFEQATALQNWFLDPGRFTYTVDFDQIRERRNPKLDPIEDFTVNHRRGHCQYFASALVLMLRSVGIPARLVVGYKGGEYNFLGQYYLVRQNNAHAWVEAYLELDEIPNNAMDPVERQAGGGWLRLDPTPARTDGSDENRGVLDRMNDSLDYAQWLWSDYVLKLTPEQQRAAGFTRLHSSNSWDWPDLINPQKWQNQASKWWDKDKAKTKRRGWAWWQWAIVICGGVATAVFIRFFWPWRLRFRRRAADRPRKPATILYYRQLEKTLRRFGWTREFGRTPREFALASGRKLAVDLDDPSLAGLPATVVEAYYQDRFRPEGAADDSIEAAAQALSALDQVYDRWRRIRRQKRKR